MNRNFDQMVGKIATLITQYYTVQMRYKRSDKEWRLNLCVYKKTRKRRERSNRSTILLVRWDGGRKLSDRKRAIGKEIILVRQQARWY